MRGWYLAALLVSFGCMLLVDARWRLALWAPRTGRRTGLRTPPGGPHALLVIVLGAGAFLAWDAAAITHGFFERGQGSALLGLELAPHLPLEEFVFVTFLCHLTLVLMGACTRIYAHLLAEPGAQQ